MSYIQVNLKSHMICQTSMGNPILNQNGYVLYLSLKVLNSGLLDDRYNGELWHLRQVHKASTSKSLTRWEQ